jgi:hypothetical protein
MSFLRKSSEVACLLIILASCNKSNVLLPPSPTVADISTNLIKQHIMVEENGQRFKVYPSEFEWCPASYKGNRSWKIEDRECYTFDYHGYKSVHGYLKDKYPSLKSGKGTPKQASQRILKIAANQTKCKVWKLMGGNADYVQGYEWGSVWFYKVSEGNEANFIPIVFDGNDIVMGYGQNFYNKITSAL